MANAEEIAEQFLMEIAILRPERRTFALLVDFVYHQLMSLNDALLRDDVLELMIPRIEQEFLLPQQPTPLASPLMEPELPQLPPVRLKAERSEASLPFSAERAPPSPAASTISFVSAETIDEHVPPIQLEPAAVQYVVAVPCIPCYIDPPQTHHITLGIPPPPPGYVNPMRSLLRTEIATIYPSTPMIIKSSSFDIQVEYQVVSPTNGEVQ